MRKGTITWIVIILVLVVVMVLTATRSWKMAVCNHEVVCGKNTGETCLFCGEPLNLIHNYEQSDCYHRTCVRCGLVENKEFEKHLKWCAGYESCQACGKNMIAVKGKYPDYHTTQTIHINSCVSVERCTLCNEDVKIYGKHGEQVTILKNKYSCDCVTKCVDCGEILGEGTHSMVRFPSSDCRQVYKCTFCGETETYEGLQHTWLIENCDLDIRKCSTCGAKEYYYSTHKFENGFLRVFDKCTRCELWQYESMDFDWGAILAEIFGVLLVAFGFQYAIRKRKFMRINWLIVIFLWLEENTFFGNFTPAVLWKKKLD